MLDQARVGDLRRAHNLIETAARIATEGEGEECLEEIRDVLAGARALVALQIHADVEQPEPEPGPLMLIPGGATECECE